MSTIAALPEQHEICQRYGSPLRVPDQSEAVGIALETLHFAPLNALRHPPEHGTSGWYIWGGESSDADGFFKPVHISHLKEVAPNLMPYMALAPGWRVLLAAGHVDVWFDEQLLNI
jgi:hypothetical protein